ncbi:hypothetical protein [Enterococcus sp. AZ196]|uniref:hypothetical protein n=1 Tax=Enterococcus sp. AZ196 TaxID=2774659 RepID=UPI003D2782B6
MELSKMLIELNQLVRKPPEDVTAKTQIHILTREIEKIASFDNEAERKLVERLKWISRMTVDKEIFRTLEKMITQIKEDGITV